MKTNVTFLVWEKWLLKQKYLGQKTDQHACRIGLISGT